MVLLSECIYRLSGGDRRPLLPVMLVVAASLPLWAAALVVLAPLSIIDQRWAVQAGLAWTGLLLAFCGGVRWGIALGPIGARRRTGAFLAAAGFMVIAAGIFFAPPVVGFTLAVAGFLLQALWDVTAGDEGRVPGWWVRVRLLAAVLFVLPALGLLVRVSLAGP